MKKTLPSIIIIFSVTFICIALHFIYQYPSLKGIHLIIGCVAMAMLMSGIFVIIRMQLKKTNNYTLLILSKKFTKILSNNMVCVYIGFEIMDLYSLISDEKVSDIRLIFLAILLGLLCIMFYVTSKSMQHKAKDNSDQTESLNGKFGKKEITLKKILPAIIIFSFASIYILLHSTYEYSSSERLWYLIIACVATAIIMIPVFRLIKTLLKKTNKYTPLTFSRIFTGILFIIIICAYSGVQIMEAFSLIPDKNEIDLIFILMILASLCTVMIVSFYDGMKKMK